MPKTTKNPITEANEIIQGIENKVIPLHGCPEKKTPIIVIPKPPDASHSDFWSLFGDLDEKDNLEDE